LRWACGSCWAAGSCGPLRAEGGAVIASIPLDRIETLFLDVGNTLVSIDFARVQTELEVLGESVAPARLERAEAAARPLISRRLLRETEDDGQRLFAAYVEEVLGQLRVSGADPGTTLHVGDLYDADVRGGRAAGIHAALLDPFDDWRHVDCQRFRDVPELQAALCAARRTNAGSRG